MRSVLVVLAAMAATVVSGGPAAAEFVRKPANVDKALMQRVAAGMAAENRATKVYVVQMAAKPGITYTGGAAGFAKTAPEAGAKYDARSGQSQMYAAHLVTQQDAALRTIGASDRKIYSYSHSFNGFAARLSGVQAAKLRKNKAVRNVWEDRRMALDTNNTPGFLGLLNETSGLRAKHGSRGKGVVIGVIDSGAVQEHPSFDDRGYKPPKNWNGICQAGEGWDADDCNNKLIGARWFADGFLAGVVMDPDDFLSPRDSDGHGTHTATTAGGREVTATLAGTRVARISGMAPDAYIAIYKACFEDLGGDQGASCFFSDSAAATEAAIIDGVDVLSFSVGTDPAFDDPQDLAFLNAVANGVFVARSSGNEGPGPSSTAAGEPWVMTVGASTHKGKRFANATHINSPASVAGDYPSLEGATTKSLQETGPITSDLVAANPIDACAPIAPIGGKIALIERGTCTFDIKLTNAVAAGASAVLAYTNLLPDGSENPKVIMGGDLTFPIPGVMIDRTPGLAIRAAMTGSPVNATLAAGVFIPESMTGDIMADFSSRGPYLTETDWIKPDITAPGVSILAGATPEPNDGSFGDLFQYLQGTSMSTPHVSGIAALLIEKHRDWSPAQIKSALMTSARQNIVKEDGVTRADPFDFGAGHILPNRALSPGLTYDAGLFDYQAASCGTVTPLVSEEDCAELEGLGFSLDPADLNLPSIAVGELVGTRTIRRVVTNVGPTATYDVTVKAPPGFQVRVKPRSITLGKGHSRTISITITNHSAPSGEWRFGSITWVGSTGRSVYSPIAVNGQAFVSPDAIAGEGAEGSASFDVTFGFSGQYTAGVHGLVNPFIQVGTGLPDDPDNGLFVGDGTGEFLAYALPIPAGTAYAQWSTFDQYSDGDHDFDLYLFYCPADPTADCPFVDGSFTFTSNETVSVDFPLSDPSGADAYLLFLHAFETEGGAPAGLAVFDWTDPGAAADQGNMTVTAPATAVSGQTGTVDVSWEGLSTGPGAKQVGAISHNDASGPIDVTSINIANDAGADFCDLAGC